MTMSARLREERERLGLSQSDFGAQAGVGRKAQSNYESGERAPDAKYLAAMAERGVDVLYVLTGLRSVRRGAFAPPPDFGLLASCTLVVDQALVRRGLAVDAEQRLRLYWGVYEMALLAGKVTDDLAERTINVLPQARPPAGKS